MNSLMLLDIIGLQWLLIPGIMFDCVPGRIRSATYPAFIMFFYLS